MKNRVDIKRGFKWSVIALVAATILHTACTTDHNALDNDFDDVELQALDSIMANFYPNAYRQTDGFYIEEIDMSNSTGISSNSFTDGWVRYNILSKNLHGEICNNRDQDIARQLGTFTYRTRYAPVMQFVTTDEDTTADYLDMLFQYTDIKMDGKSTGIYANDHFKVYVPSQIQGVANGTYGYAGQNSIGSAEFMVSEIEVIETFENGWDWEVSKVYEFMEMNTLDNWTRVSYRIDEDDLDYDEDDDVESYYDYDDSETKIYIYYDTSYTPYTKYNYIEQYNYSYLPYVTIESPNTTYFEQLQSDIADAVVEEFGEGDNDEGDIIATDEYVKIWYIARTLDGFIIDTNIDEVAELAFADQTGGNTYIYYQCDASATSYIDAWFFAVQDLRYGEWSTFITPSLYAYSYEGVSGTSTTTEIPPYTPLLFSVYIEEE
ncbi:MAG: hypothetical protein R3Y16_04995 [Rikenellaceae bacterium]